MKTKRQIMLEEDISTLNDFLTSDKPLQTRHIRAAAPAILRKWLIDKNLDILAKELNVVFELPLLDTSEIFDSLKNSSTAIFYMSGGVLIGGLPTNHIYVSKNGYYGKPEIPVELKNTLMTTGKFISSKRIYFEKDWFSTEQVIRFVANKHGGVHYDEKRSKDWQYKLEQANEYCTFGNPEYKDKSGIIELTDEPHGKFMIIVPKEKGNIWGCLDIEILAIAQSLVNIHCNGQQILNYK